MSPKYGVDIVEVAPRDGLQNETRVLSISARVQLIRRLVSAGVGRIEAVSFVRDDLVPQMAFAEKVMARLPTDTQVSYIGLVLNRKGAYRAVGAGCHEINVVVAATDKFSVRNQGMTVAAMLDEAAEAIAVAKAAGLRTTITVAVAFGCPFAGVVPLDHVALLVERIAQMGPDEIAFADTIGVGVPRQVKAMAEMSARARFDNIRFHFHNTRNTGYVNAYEAICNRSHFDSVAIDASVGGFGGCPFAPAATGNIATEDLLYMLKNEGIPLTTVRGCQAYPVTLELDQVVGIGRWLGGQLDKEPMSLLSRTDPFTVEALI